MSTDEFIVHEYEPCTFKSIWSGELLVDGAPDPAIRLSALSRRELDIEQELFRKPPKTQPGKWVAEFHVLVFEFIPTVETVVARDGMRIERSPAEIALLTHRYLNAPFAGLLSFCELFLPEKIGAREKSFPPHFDILFAGGQPVDEGERRLGYPAYHLEDGYHHLGLHQVACPFGWDEDEDEQYFGPYPSDLTVAFLAYRIHTKRKL